MTYVFTVFLKIVTMLLYAVPAFLLVKTRLVKESAIAAFSTVLMYVLQPALTISSFQAIEAYSPQLIGNMAICFFVALGAMGSFMIVFYRLFRKKRGDVSCRVANVAVAFSNASFTGIPVLQTVFSSLGRACPEAAAYSIVFSLAMSVLGWTVASAIITQDKKYISLKKIFLNPCSISLYAAVALAVAGYIVGSFTGTVWKIPSPFSDMFDLLGQMTTPLCMIVTGFRLATADLKKLFLTPLHYFVVVIKQIAFPLFVFAITVFLPVDANLKICLFVMSCCPVAALVQSYAEMIGEGQESAADMVLLSSSSCVLTIPLMMLLLPLLG